jgi:glutamine synthetase
VASLAGLAQKLRLPQITIFTTTAQQEYLMAKTVADVIKMVKENEVKFVDFRFTDTRGKEQHVTVPVSHFDEDKFTSGHAFDGSSIAGWKGIEASDMQLMPDPNTANIDPFFEETTLFLSCDVVEPSDGKAYDRDPRSIAKRAEAYLKASGMGDTAYFGPEPEFFIFDDVRWGNDMSGPSSRSTNTKPLEHRQEARRRQQGPPSPPSRAAISRCLRSTARRTCAPRCR